MLLAEYEAGEMDLGAAQEFGEKSLGISNEALQKTGSAK
jgi:hypothetical protein